MTSQHFWNLGCMYMWNRTVKLSANKVTLKQNVSSTSVSGDWNMGGSFHFKACQTFLLT